jgi:hypothetical protein
VISAAKGSTSAAKCIAKARSYAAAAQESGTTNLLSKQHAVILKSGLVSGVKPIATNGLCIFETQVLRFTQDDRVCEFCSLRRLLIRVCHAQNRALVKVLAEYLHADRQLFL